VPRWLRAAAESTIAALGVFLFLLVLIAGYFGNQESSENIATVLVWVLWWIGPDAGDCLDRQRLA
jgi:hypothetical protein